MNDKSSNLQDSYEKFLKKKGIDYSLLDDDSKMWCFYEDFLESKKYVNESQPPSSLLSSSSSSSSSSSTTSTATTVTKTIKTKVARSSDWGKSKRISNRRPSIFKLLESASTSKYLPCGYDKDGKVVKVLRVQ